MTTVRHENKLVRLVDLVVTMTPPMLEDVEFVNCELIGPAVLLVLDDCHFDHAAIDGAGSLWELDAGREYVGGIGVRRCTFSKVQFRGVGLAGPAAFVQQFMDDLRGL